MYIYIYLMLYVTKIKQNNAKFRKKQENNMTNKENVSKTSGLVQLPGSSRPTLISVSSTVGPALGSTVLWSEASPATMALREGILQVEPLEKP